jgi:tRNA nucleotidyltransferase/poly(A) polymerase
MGEITKEIDVALKNTIHLLGTISGERIRDEFIKGLNSAKKQKFFIETLAKYNLFDWIFKGLKVDFSVTPTLNKNIDYVVLIARLLKGNELDVLKKKLNALNYSIDEVKAITFLIAMLKLSVDTAVTLKKAEKHAGITPEQLNEFAKAENINTKLIEAFTKFNLTVSGQEVMDNTGLKQGPELGKAIQQIETDNFKKLL